MVSCSCSRATSQRQVSRAWTWNATGSSGIVTIRDRPETAGVRIERDIGAAHVAVHADDAEVHDHERAGAPEVVDRYPQVLRGDSRDEVVDSCDPRSRSSRRGTGCVPVDGLLVDPDFCVLVPDPPPHPASAVAVTASTRARLTPVRTLRTCAAALSTETGRLARSSFVRSRMS